MPLKAELSLSTYLLLKHFRRFRELPDVAEAEDGVHFPPRHHGVQVPAVLHVLADDLRPRVAEADRQQGTDFGDGSLQALRLDATSEETILRCSGRMQATISQGSE